jgi:hypothetical protein
MTEIITFMAKIVFFEIKKPTEYCNMYCGFFSVTEVPEPV